jgi:hypothetical protein
MVRNHLAPHLEAIPTRAAALGVVLVCERIPKAAMTASRASLSTVSPCLWSSGTPGRRTG